MPVVFSALGFTARIAVAPSQQVSRQPCGQIIAPRIAALTASMAAAVAVPVASVAALDVNLVADCLEN